MQRGMTRRPVDDLAFERCDADQRILCVFNIGNQPAHWTPAEPDKWQAIMATESMADWQFEGFAALVASHKP